MDWSRWLLTDSGKFQLNKIAAPQPWQAIAQRFCSMEVYRDLEFTRCFAEPAVNGQLALLDTYNGAGKAVWVDISGESV